MGMYIYIYIVYAMLNRSGVGGDLARSMSDKAQTSTLVYPKLSEDMQTIEPVLQWWAIMNEGVHLAGLQDQDDAGKTSINTYIHTYIHTYRSQGWICVCMPTQLNKQRQTPVCKAHGCMHVYTNLFILTCYMYTCI